MKNPSTRRPTGHDPVEASLGASRGGVKETQWREIHAFMRLAREWDVRFERLLKTGGIGKWYSAVGNEAITVPAAHCLEAGDALLTLHRDVGAILRYYFDVATLFPHFFAAPTAPTSRRQDRNVLYRLACQMLGKADGFTSGRDRSYHYNYCDRRSGILHFGMISHLGAMIPVAAGVAFALQQEGGGRVALHFVGEGATSTGDFHEALNMASVYSLPLVLVIENNGFAFSTPTTEQFACRSLAARGDAYGIPGVAVDGTDADAVLSAVATAVERGRGGAGPTLIEARVGRLRGHSEGDDSLAFARRVAPDPPVDPLEALESKMVAAGDLSTADVERIATAAHELVLTVVDAAAASPDPDPSASLGSPYAE